jgi:pilus assembly protein FimV
VLNNLKNSQEADSLTSRLSFWRTPVAAAALALALGLPALEAHALALGKVNVLSALGEPLRAEIEVPEINADEAASLKANIASGDAFRAAGLEYNPALKNAQLSLQRRPDGRSYFRLTSDTPINEPFVDLILETTWATGRVTRDYTMLFDPSNLRAQAAPAPTAAAGVSPSSTSPATVSPRTSTSPAVGQAPARAPRPPAVRAPAAPAPSPAAESAKPGSVTVKAGNTATQLAVRYKPADISLDQMLVSMLTMNPDAFIDGNINRMKKGAVLEMPTTSTASGVSEEQARQTITAQSKDFNEFRRRLAQGAPTASASDPGRKAAGTVQADVQERKPTAAAPDKLTLSKGAVGAAGTASASKGMKEEAIAKEKAAKDAAARTAELSKNIQDLNKLGTSTVASAKPTAPAATPAAAASAPGIAVATGSNTTPVVTSTVVKEATATVASAAPLVTATVAPAVTASVAVATDTAATTATAAPVVPEKPVAKAPPPPPPEPSFLEGLLGNPITLPAAGVLLALLAGFGAYRMRQRKNAAQVDSSFLESRLQPDSFFGASGGQRVDTNDAPNSASASSMVYSPSQLDAAGDVDPVAEADVYLAYGRDLQAEEILKEALRTNPSRVAIHAKLMEIYAKRRDTKAFETVAREAYAITRGQGTEWDTAAALGREMDPGNPLYQPSGINDSLAVAGMGAAAAATAAFASSTAPQTAQAATADDVDFDLDFSMDDGLVDAPQVAEPAHTSTSPIHVQPTVSMQAQAAAPASVDLAFDAPALPDLAASAMNMSGSDRDSFANGLSFSNAPAAAPSTPTAPMAMASSASYASAIEPLEFDLGDLSLDLPKAAAPVVSAAAASSAIDAGITGDPLETKLALAQEFREIGDDDGARSLAEEVAQEAVGALKARAQRMVAELS